MVIELIDKVIKEPFVTLLAISAIMVTTLTIASIFVSIIYGTILEVRNRQLEKLARLNQEFMSHFKNSNEDKD